MTPVDWLLDGVLALALPLLAWRVLATDDLPRAVVLFIALGFLSALAWARLGAPDVALVEAAVGAGLTGALLMSTLASTDAAPQRASALRAPSRALLALVLLLLVAGLGWTAWVQVDRDTGLTREVFAQLDRSGVSHPVTAVLLNFRAYDTLLEVAVLLVAAIGVRSVSPVARLPHGRPDPGEPLIAMLAGLLLPGVLLVSGYLLWTGSHAPGGAFQAGAILAGGGVLLLLARVIHAPEMSTGLVRAALLIGPCLFFAVATVPILTGGRLLEYPVAWAPLLIFAVECALTLSIAAVLIMFFPGGRSAARPVELPQGEPAP